MDRTEAEDRFRSIPWCATLLNQPDTIIFTPSARLDNATGGLASKDQLLRRTLNTPDAAPHCIGFYRDPVKEVTPRSISPRLLINSASLLFDIGPGVNGFHGSAHGGFMAVMMDDAMGSLIYHNYVLQAQKQQKDPAWRLPTDTLDLSKVHYFTAGIDMRYRKPLPTPSVAICTASLNRVEGRKLLMDVTIKDEHGTVFATGNGLWMSMPSGKI
jgi:acyl-coenzyme A thioesterase PaaI-like protein